MSPLRGFFEIQMAGRLQVAPPFELLDSRDFLTPYELTTVEAKKAAKPASD
jgi:hypothetical protein